MKVFSLSDLHLALGTPGKSMAVFGDHWTDHTDRIAETWSQCVGEDDIVLLAGDISWAMKLERAIPDLEFIAGLPGRKVMIRGNHDYWWNSPKKIRDMLPEKMYIIQNDVVNLDGVSLAGSRLWIDHQLPMLRLRPRLEEGQPLNKNIPLKKMRTEPEKSEEEKEQDEKIFQRELNRLKLSLDQLDENADLKIAMVHFPPLSTDLTETRTTTLLEEAGIAHCVFGHLHNLHPSPGKSMFGCRKGIAYHLTSCDYLDFIPALIAEI